MSEQSDERVKVLAEGWSMGEAGHAATASWLLDVVDEWRLGSEVQRHRPGWFSCSELGEPDEELINRYMGFGTRGSGLTGRHMRVFDLGHDRDRSWKRYLSESGLSVIKDDGEREVSLPHLRLRGSLDDIARHPKTKRLWVIEFKTANPFTYQRLMEPLPSHRLQVQAYMACTSLKDALVVYENKGDQAVKCFEVRFDEGVWEEQAQRLVRLRAEAEERLSKMDPKVVDLSAQLIKEMTRRK